MNRTVPSSSAVTHMPPPMCETDCKSPCDNSSALERESIDSARPKVDNRRAVDSCVDQENWIRVGHTWVPTSRRSGE